MKVAELEGPSLNYWVARAEGVFGKHVTLRPFFNPRENVLWDERTDYPHELYEPSTQWYFGGPIIERVGILLGTVPGDGAPQWVSAISKYHGGDMGTHQHYGPTPLIAAMRCFVASKFGEEVPDAGHST